MINIIEARELNEKPVFSFNAGLQIFFNVNTFLNIESGAEFYQQRNGFLNIPITDLDDYDVVYGYVDSYYMLNYISLPVKFNFKIFEKINSLLALV